MLWARSADFERQRLPRRLDRGRGLSAGEVQDAPVRVSYLRFVAEGPVCGAWPTNLAFEPNNLPYPNFGCANQEEPCRDGR